MRAFKEDKQNGFWTFIIKVLNITKEILKMVRKKGNDFSRQWKNLEKGSIIRSKWFLGDKI